MTSRPSPELLAKTSVQYVANTIAERQSQEIVIALVGPVGSGVSTAAAYIDAILREYFAYKVCAIIKPSEIISDEAHRVDESILSSAKKLDKYITEMQNTGNKLREKFGNDYLTEKAVERIYSFRKRNEGFYENRIPLPGRRAYIIDSLKNPEELKLLRQIYGETLCVFGIFAPDAVRALRLKNNNVPERSVQNIMDRDRSEIETFG